MKAYISAFSSMLISQKLKSIQPDPAKNSNVKKNVVNIKHFSALYNRKQD